MDGDRLHPSRLGHGAPDKARCWAGGEGVQPVGTASWESSSLGDEAGVRLHGLRWSGRSEPSTAAAPRAPRVPSPASRESEPLS